MNAVGSDPHITPGFCVIDNKRTPGSLHILSVTFVTCFNVPLALVYSFTFDIRFLLSETTGSIETAAQNIHL